VCRDEIKEGMAHAEGPEFRGGPGDPLTQRTLPLFFEVLELFVRAGVSVVAEAAFQDRLWRPGLEPLAGLAELRIVRCHADPAVSFERARARPERHGRAHGDSTIGKEAADWARTFEAFEYPSLAFPALDVDTTDRYDPDLQRIVEFVHR
jgi:predicted kinase